MYILGYGSLINSASLHRTIKREILHSEMIAVKLHNYTRLWNLKNTVHSKELNQQVTAIFLNIERNNGKLTNGVIFEVNSLEFKDLTKRERNYDPIDVTNLVEPYTNNLLIRGPVYTYVATNDLFIQSNKCPGHFVMRKYTRIVEDGCKAMGADFYQDYLNWTEPNPFDLLGGEYEFLSKDS